MHRALAIEAHNSMWDRFGRPPAEIAVDGAEQRPRQANAAAYEWARAEDMTPVNAARADRPLSQVWVARGNGPLALIYADRCMASFESEGLVAFDLPYAHEARARGFTCLFNRHRAQQSSSTSTAALVIHFARVLLGVAPAS